MYKGSQGCKSRNIRSQLALLLYLYFNTKSLLLVGRSTWCRFFLGICILASYKLRLLKKPQCERREEFNIMEQTARPDMEKASKPEPDSLADTEGNLQPDSPKLKDDLPPDGGAAAWLVVLGAWCCSFCSPGWVNSTCLSSPLHTETCSPVFPRHRQLSAVLRSGTATQLL